MIRRQFLQFVTGVLSAPLLPSFLYRRQDEPQYGVINYDPSSKSVHAVAEVEKKEAQIVIGMRLTSEDLDRLPEDACVYRSFILLTRTVPLRARQIYECHIVAAGTPERIRTRLDTEDRRGGIFGSTFLIMEPRRMREILTGTRRKAKRC